MNQLSPHLAKLSLTCLLALTIWIGCGSSTGTHAFFIVTQPASTTLASDEAAAFPRTFSPLSVGRFTDTAAIFNNDPDKNPYTFVISGTSLAANCYVSLGATTDYVSSDAQALRDAVSAASAGDTVKVAGYCAGVGGDTHNSHQQVMDLDKDLTVRGGYTFTNWTISDPTNHPTILDAGAGGRVVWVDSSASVTIENINLTNGAATSDSGGAIYVNGSSTTVVINNSQIYSNTAHADGGGILNNRATVSIINSAVYSNSTISNRGGGVANQFSSALLTLSNSRVHHNTAANTGGGVWNRYDGQVVINDSQIYNNTSGTAGAGLYTVGGGAVLSISDSRIYSNSGSNGAGIYYSGGQHSLSNVQIYNNASRASGGGFYNTGATISMTTTEIYSNSASSNGGGLYASGGGVALTDTAIHSNTANGGGGLYNTGGSTISINNSPVYNNQATGYGGGLHNYGSSSQIIITGTHIYSNSANDAGGIRDFHGKIWLTNSDVYSNMTTARGGGIGIEQSKAVMTIANSRIHDNQAGTLGGGIWLRYHSKLLISDSDIYENSSGSRGGGVYFTGKNSQLTITETKVYSNITVNGGALYVNSGQATLTGTAILSNTASTNGGAFLMSNSSAAYLTVNNSCIVNNSDTAVQTGNSNHDLIATGDWWGAENGPSGQGPGGGDSVSNNVDYSGFLTTALFDCPTYPKADLEISKTVDPTSASPGDSITYTLNFTNNGPGPAVDVIITDTLPVSLTNVSYTNSGPAVAPTGSVSYTWLTADLNPGETGLITITAQIANNLPRSSFTNTATITTARTIESNTLNNQAEAGLAVSNKPVLVFIGAQTISETYTLTFTAGAADSDLPAQTLTYSLSGEPSGASINASTGLFSWTPTETQGPGVYTFTVVVSDTDNLTDSETIAVTVNEVNNAPQFISAPVTFVTVGTMYNYTVVTTDEDEPVGGGDLTITLISGPAWLSLTDYRDGTALLSGAPGDSDVGDYTVVLQVSDGALTATQTFTLTASTGGGRNIFLPIIINHSSPSPAAPDLVVDSLVAAGDAVTVTIRNAGGATADAFWVDVYFNPNPAPPGLNQQWDAIAPAGAAWGVTQSLAQDETLELTIGGAYYFGPPLSSSTFPVGATVYAYVDSINYDTTYGNAPESNEGNNLGGPVISTAGSDAAIIMPMAVPILPEGLPQR